MAKQINCECGYVARGEAEDEVIALIRDHMRSDHPALLDQVSDRGPPRVDRGDLSHSIGGCRDEHRDV